MTDSKNSSEKTNKAVAPSPALNYLLLSAGSIFTSMLIAGFLVGYALDELFDTKPIFLLGCAVLGFIGGIQKVHRLTSRLDNLPATEQKDSEKS